MVLDGVALFRKRRLQRLRKFLFLKFILQIRFSHKINLSDELAQGATPTSTKRNQTIVG